MVRNEKICFDEQLATGGYQNAGGGSVATAISLPDTDINRNYTLDGLGNWRATGFTPVGSSAQVDQRNNKYGELASNPNQNDNKDWIAFSITLTDLNNPSNTLTQSPGSGAGNFYMAINSAAATPPTSVDMGISASVQSGGPDFGSGPEEVDWSISGNSATPASGSPANGTGTPSKLEKVLGRRLRPLPVGRPRKKRTEDGKKM